MLRMVNITGPQPSSAVGSSKPHSSPHSTVVSSAQVMAGAVVSSTVTVWLYWAVFPQSSVASQVRVASKVSPQNPTVLVTVLSTVTVTFPHVSLAVGSSKTHGSRATPSV